MNNVQKPIPFGSEKHQKLVTEVTARKEYSETQMKKKYSAWNKAEDAYMLYRPEQDEDKKTRRKRESTGKPAFVTLHVPYSYALLLTAHTYFSTVFLGRSPINQFSGRHGEAESSVTALESIIDYQVSVGEMQTVMSIWLMDVGKYGLGVTGEYWEENYATTSQYIERPKKFLGFDISGKTERVLQMSKQCTYKGNKLYNIRPYDFFPDPRVSLKDFQKGEFCGRAVEVSWNEIKRRQAAGIYFNIDALEKNLAGQDGFKTQNGSSQIVLPGGAGKAGDSGTAFSKSIKDFVKLFELTIEIIPREEPWGFHQGRDPEKWVLTLANDSVIIGCQPMGNYHNKFPFNVLEYEIDGYAHAKRGMLEITSDLNEIMTWLFNSRMYNVRKLINGMMVVDPSRIVMKDITADGAAKLIRMKPAAYGQEVKNFLQQVQVQDVTRSHMQDATTVAEMMQRIVGVTENIMGMLNAGGRKTATEVRTSSSFGVNRLKTLCEYFSACGFAPLAQKLVQNTQQYYDLDHMFRIAGQDIMQAGYLKVSPEMIAGFYDFVPVDGTLPIDKFALASLWKEVILGAVQIPQLAMRYDIPGMFGWAAEMMGLKNIKQFEIKVSPDQNLTNQATAGNVVPISQGNRNATNLATAQANGAPPGQQTGAQGAPVVTGMGPVG